MSPTPSSSLQAYALRLRPGDDLRQRVLVFVAAHHIEAGAVLTCVGSLTDVSLRLTNQEAATHYHGHFEILSLGGTWPWPIVPGARWAATCPMAAGCIPLRSWCWVHCQRCVSSGKRMPPSATTSW